MIDARVTEVKEDGKLTLSIRECATFNRATPWSVTPGLAVVAIRRSLESR